MANFGQMKPLSQSYCLATCDIILYPSFDWLSLCQIFSSQGHWLSLFNTIPIFWSGYIQVHTQFLMLSKMWQECKNKQITCVLYKNTRMSAIYYKSISIKLNLFKCYVVKNFIYALVPLAKLSLDFVRCGILVRLLA
jgi:hypothetical protein